LPEPLPAESVPRVLISTPRIAVIYEGMPVGKNGAGEEFMEIVGSKPDDRGNHSSEAIEFPGSSSSGRGRGRLVAFGRRGITIPDNPRFKQDQATKRF